MFHSMTQQAQEEYIWAMRNSAFRTADDQKIQSIRKNRSIAGSLAAFDHETKVMASMVPDEVIQNVKDYNLRHYDAAVLFGDVSGFTELCEKYTKAGVSGPSRMTQALNSYLGSMVQEIMSHQGDVLKFSGDAFLALFKSSESDTMRDVAHAALDCALVIQKTYGAYATDVGVVIRVKLAVSCGPITISLIGDETNSHYVMVGKPVWDVKAAEKISKAGDIIVAPAAWYYVNATEYAFQEMSDKIHVNVIGVGSTWRSSQKTVKSKQTTTKEEDEEEINDDNDETSAWQDDDDDVDKVGFDMDEFALRPAVNLATRLRIKDQLRKFIIAPVMRSIDMNEPFEYLTEMRQAVICFINVVSQKLSDDETCIFTDKVYKTVCNIVNKMKGCVNKVSLFDKDLMLVIIFGLRGFKHELECQMALRCSHQVHQAIMKIPKVITASLGVTTGKTYCGVFGHTLRREYTVISLICNKAARLMVNYPGQVTCDRESFLHSKLEAQHFILQPAKALKGITHPGPVYQFKEVEIKHNVFDKVHPSPLLGRHENCQIYKNLLENCLKTKKLDKQEDNYKMLLIEGEARQGKTRLLNELIFLTPDSISIFKITLTIKDYLIPYRGIRLLFYTPLDLNSESSVQHKERKLQNIFLRSEAINLLCVLNDIFGVDFRRTDQFLKLDKEEIDGLRKFMLKSLCQTIFTRLWIIAFDNFEYLDDESWKLFECFFDIGNIFFLATIGRENLDQFHQEDPEKSGLLADLRIVRNLLTPIEKWYLGALACQVLDVYAISPELENAIQTRSNGNPGWIESFLISSIQDHALHISEASLREINDLGLVCPPLYMMQRLSDKERQKWKHIMEEQRPSVESLNEDHWKKYIDSCRDSYLNITIREQIESSAKGGTATICIISENFSVGEEEAELSMDSMVLRTFDSLTFYEQLLVKCGAILGNQFLRSMLVYVMAETSSRRTALAVKKLFEIQVLTCAKGDFLEGARIYKEKYESPLEETKRTCKCRGVAPDETCLDLPKYASCGYIQFKSTLFRDITYNLLTNQQKKEFHSRAIRYLEKETRRCKSCGYGFFENILRARQKQDKEFLKKRDKRIRYEGSGEGSFSTFGSDGTSQRGSLSQETSKKSVVLKVDERSISSFQISSEDTRAFVSSTFFGFTVINKLKNSFSLTRTFSAEDFSDCRCNLILSTTYAQLIDHCRGANEYIKLTTAHTEYAYICLNLCNFPLAIQTLEEALYSIRDLGTADRENAWKASLLRGKLYAMMGYAKMEMGHFDQALENFKRCLKEYRLEFPIGSNRQCMIRQFKIKQKFGLYIFPSFLMKHLDYWESTYYNNLSECLSHLCRLYMLCEEWKNAELASYWSITKALEAFSDFSVIITACANMILVLQHFAEWTMSVALEVHALQICHLKKSRVEKDDLTCVAKLYAAIFSSRICRSDLEKGIQMGYACMRISASIHDIRILLFMLPTLAHILLLRSHFDSASSILRSIEELFTEDTDYSAKVWYYALCVGFHLETGYCIMNYNACEESYDMEGENWIYNRESEALSRFLTVMWLWCIRNEKWEQASIWFQKITNPAIPKNPNSFASRITDLYRLEGLIIFLVNKLDKRNIQAVIKAEDEIKQLIDSLEKLSKIFKILLPRLLHLKAYFKFVKNKDFEVHTALKKAQNVALQCGNELDFGWLEHSGKTWDNSLSSLMVNFWREHCDPEKLLDFNELEAGEGKLGLFTLNVPTYI